MKNIKLILTSSLVVAATAVATMNSAEARRIRHFSNEYVVSAGVCGAPTSGATYIYPAPNWEPFFQRHVYRYGPILICEPTFQTTKILSVRY
ncbi:hypothetical protein [Bradyrhizobium sp. sBnM-33]|uniref:hypothetical protein n=1 Tax=Bradyrhizobium sp. sBnM-33 TaxID=2831780 RepID=UPI001BCCC79D|nr:hypothetical protein [Bradyrhizobium sp. sBnM-33]WOH53640.1 hypothetical protein RX328_17070 [Bradyrhizobium sp. sBnM-33]